MDNVVDGQIPMAFLVDGDNASASRILEMLTETSKYGPVIIRNVYGDWSSPQMRNWKEVRLDHALQTVQQFPNISGKNATDSALIIDAMDILHQGVAKGFCIVSSDSDFTTLAMRLRKGGAFVLGIGEEKTHVSFRNACDRFILTENIASDPIENLHPVSPSISQKVEVVAEPVRKGRPVVEALDILLRGYDNAELDVGSAYLSRMGEEITKIDPSFDARTYGKRKLKDMIEELPNYFVFEKDKGGQGRDIVKRKSAKK